MVAARIYDSDGKAFAGYQRPGTRTEDLPAPRLAPGRERFDGQFFDLRRNISFNDEIVGSILIRSTTEELTERFERYVEIILVLLMALGGFAVVISSRLRNRISRPLTALARGSESIAAGDLATRVEVSTGDEIGVLARAFNDMALGLRGLVIQVRDGVREVGDVVRTLAESGGELTRQSERQATAIAETAASVDELGVSIRGVNANVEQLADSGRETSSSIIEMNASIGAVADDMDRLGESIDKTATAVTQVTLNGEQISESVGALQIATEYSLERHEQLRASVKQVGDNARESHELSEDAAGEATKGISAVNETIAAMGEISSSFGKVEQCITRLAKKSVSIDEILQVIKSVAEQTSLLSLNAAIIAAQAGEHGRAFSVVADEVSGLADRTHDATQEIGNLIRAVREDTGAAVAAVEAGAAKVEKGVQRSNVAGRLLRKIGEKSQVSTARVWEISEAASRQGHDLERVDQAMIEVKQIVEQIIRSIHDQTNATAEIANAVERMRSLGHRVKSSTDEQRRGSRFITNAVTNVAAMINQIAEATQSQAINSETIQQALQVFRGVTDETTRRAEAINTVVSTLSERSERLEREVDRFKTE